MLSRKFAVLVSFGVAALFLLAAFCSSLGFFSPGEVKTVARPVPSAAILAGRDDPDRQPTELLPGDLININTASPAELQRLPGIGEVISQAIVDYREANGPFLREDALMEVSGIGPARFAAVADHITIGDVP